MTGGLDDALRRAQAHHALRRDRRVHPAQVPRPAARARAVRRVVRELPAELGRALVHDVVLAVRDVDAHHDGGLPPPAAPARRRRRLFARARAALLVAVRALLRPFEPRRAGDANSAPGHAEKTCSHPHRLTFHHLVVKRLRRGGARQRACAARGDVGRGRLHRESGREVCRRQRRAGTPTGSADA